MSTISQYDEPIGPQLPPSANGFVLFVGRHIETAAWPAPYFALHILDDDERTPLLQHCETLADARWRTGSGGTILNWDFSEYHAAAPSSEDRECVACGADVVGNEPHAPYCNQC